MQWVGQSVAFQGEYADGELLGRDRDGWYGQLSVVNNPNYTPFVKYQEYRSSDGVVNGAMSNCDAIEAGVALQLDPNNEVTIQITDRDTTVRAANQAAQSMDAFEYGVSWQTSY